MQLTNVSASSTPPPTTQTNPRHFNKRMESTAEGEYGFNPVAARRGKKPGLLERFWRYLGERSINSRLIQFEVAEAKSLKKQRLAKVDAIFAEQSAKFLLIQQLVTTNSQQLLQETWEVLRRKYGIGMSEWLLERAKQSGLDIFKEAKTLQESFMAVESSIASYVDEEALRMNSLDPLENWFKNRQSTDISDRMMARIQKLAAAISSKVKWSLLIEPGRPRTDLSNFFTEFDILDGFFDKVELSVEERSQRAFDANCLTKARDKRMECADFSRVELTLPAETTKEDESTSGANKRRLQPSDIFGDPDCPEIRFDGEYGHSDFIHASRVLGGPLLNTFILTQAPLPQTIPDFWRMVWQERSEFIFMLCDASEFDKQGLMSSAIPNHCPVYWPRCEGEVRQFGRLVVRNEGLDSRVDPLFNVTHLALWMEDKPDDKLNVQHWQWDWNTFTDFHWPFRLLLRSRQSKRPTIVQCMDGCGRSGTLVLIEIFLMQLLRGATSQHNPMLTSAVFLRLQRRHAVTNHMHYLFAYRTVLHWIQPYVTSRYHRFVLGYALTGGGFIGKYERIVSSLPEAGSC